MQLQNRLWNVLNSLADPQKAHRQWIRLGNACWRGGKPCQQSQKTRTTRASCSAPVEINEVISASQLAGAWDREGCAPHGMLDDLLVSGRHVKHAR